MYSITTLQHCHDPPGGVALDDLGAVLGLLAEELVEDSVLAQLLDPVLGLVAAAPPPGGEALNHSIITIWMLKAADCCCTVRAGSCLGGGGQEQEAASCGQEVSPHGPRHSCGLGLVGGHVEH